MRINTQMPVCINAYWLIEAQRIGSTMMQGFKSSSLWILRQLDLTQIQETQRKTTWILPLRPVARTSSFIPYYIAYAYKLNALFVSCEACLPRGLERFRSVKSKRLIIIILIFKTIYNLIKGNCLRCSRQRNTLIPQ